MQEHVRPPVRYERTIRRLGRGRWGARVQVIHPPDPSTPFTAPPEYLQPRYDFMGPSVSGCEFVAYTHRGLLRSIQRAERLDRRERTQRDQFRDAA